MSPWTSTLSAGNAHPLAEAMHKLLNIKKELKAHVEVGLGSSVGALVARS